jgi:maleylpyruvate isomerase
MPLVLHNYFRSSASYRVRIALGLKGLPYEYITVHLNRDGGQQHTPAFKRLNPQGLVPTLDDGHELVSQSAAILEYLEELHPDPCLLPRDPGGRAYVRSIAAHIACDIHPLNNLRVLKYLSGTLDMSEASKSSWIAHWIASGLAALEAQLAASSRSGRFCHGDTPGMADCFLVPQIFSARRFDVDLTPYPRLLAIDAACNELEAFRMAAPALQPDAE